MTTTLTVYDTPSTAAPTKGFWSRSRKAGAVYIVLGLLAAVLFGVLAKAGHDARFTLSTTVAGRSLPIPGRAGAIGSPQSRQMP